MEILTTTNYDYFKNFETNRTLNSQHLNRLIRSFKDQYLICPIMVNEFNQIIDGQHRFEAAKQLGLPIYYYRVNGYTDKQMQILNETMRQWSKQDFLSHYVSKGLESYLQFKELWNSFPEYQFSCIVQFCGLKEKGGGSGNSFKNGTMKIKDINEAYKFCRMVKDFAPYYDEYYTLRFVSPTLTLFRKPNYDHRLMLHKLSLRPRSLVACGTYKQWLEMYEEIYNYKNKNKINLRF